MSQKIDNIIREIEERTKPNQPILVGEGVSDPKALLAWLKNHAPTVEEKWSINPANGKQNVLDILTKKPEWLGVVDRDTWSQEEIDSKCQQYPNLFVLPRWCIESYLIQPHEWWEILPSSQQNSITQADFTKILDAELPRYLRHAVLWKVIHPLRDTLHQLGFVKYLASESSITVAQDDASIQRMLTGWHTQLEPNMVLTHFHAQLAAVENMPKAQQLAEWVHGKCFWEDVVAPALTRHFRQRKSNVWRDTLFKQLTFPDDLQPLLQRMQQWEIPQP